MVSWRFWLVVLALVPAFVSACSGESGEEKPGGDGSGAEAGDASSGASAGRSAGGRGGTAGSAAEGGEGAEPSRGGSPNAGGSGGTGATPGTGGSPIAGRGGADSGGSATGGFGMMAGFSGTGGVPGLWDCPAAAYGDGVCHCGCGVPDVDCKDDDIDECEVCNVFGSCDWDECPGKINPNNPSRCLLPPDLWTCGDYYYRDGSTCHCGCGVPDPDCEDDSRDSCDVCNIFGSCSGGSCPGTIDEEDNTRCDVPEEWRCAINQYADGFTCDCGCGIVDPDCASASRDECDSCRNGCSDEYCPGPIDADNNAICTGVPSRWLCPARFFGDGELCNCGCGAEDPDCESSTDIAECESCDVPGSCSARACPNTIDPDNTSFCEQPPPPEGWTCSAYQYADSYICDCGCGVVDLDCRTSATSECERCYTCGGSCPGRVDPEDNTQCVEPPASWECEDYLYADGAYCDCGCGALDPDCDSAAKEACYQCLPNAGSCSDYGCTAIEAADNTRCIGGPPAGWTCDRDYYGDRACDCGCGVLDSDCDGPSRDECVFCDGEGSCSDSDCPGSIDAENSAVCVAG